MQTQKKIMYSFMISSGILLLSFFLPIIPCRKAPNIPNPMYKWTMCTMNPDSISKMNSLVEYFGYTIKFNNAVLITTISVFAITYITLVIAARKHKKNRRK